MPIISTIGRKSVKARILMAGLYLLLTIGAITMLYPFLLMVSLSITSKVDYHEYRLVPRYLYRKEILFRKYLEEKYFKMIPRIDMLNDAYGTDYLKFQDVALPEFNGEDRKELNMVNDWNEFKTTLPAQYRLVYFEERVKELYRRFLRERYKDGIASLNKEYIEQNDNFFQVLPPFEDPLWAGWEPDGTKKTADWSEFKAQLPALYIGPVAVDPYYQKYLKKKYEDIENLNLKWDASYRSFSQIHLSRTIPSNPAQESDWSDFVTTKLPDRYKDYPDGAEKTVYTMRVESSENLFQEFLREKYGSDFSNVLPPYQQADVSDFSAGYAGIKRDFIAKNYKQVINYIILHGRSLFNTAVLCTAMILTALTVNPLCAYALSRFKLSYTFKILLFLLATMAFPAEVAMIPSFLLMRQFHLLNTYWALVLPGVASGFSIFLLKGFFDSLPEELYESAKIDGAGNMRMFWAITVPLSKPILAVIALGAFGTAYGGFMWAFIVCQNPKMWTLMVHLYQLQIGTPAHVVMAALTISSIPTLVVFIFCQKIIMRGIILPIYK